MAKQKSAKPAATKAAKAAPKPASKKATKPNKAASSIPEQPCLKAFGIDISKDTLEVALSPTGPNHTLPNDPKGIKKLIALASKHRPDILIFEPTGGFERELRCMLSKTKIQFSMVDAARVRHFILAKGERAKTDKIDARMLADYGTTMKAPVTVKLTPEEEELRALNDRRTQLVDTLTREEGHLKSAHPCVAHHIEKNITYTKAEIRQLDKLIVNHISSSPKLSHKYRLLTSVKGVGVVVATTILSRMPEIGLLNRNQAAALVGVAPHPKSSGKKVRPPSISGGRSQLRKALYMATLSVISRAGRLKDFYEGLRKRGKPPKVAMIAVMRKLTVMLNAIIRDSREWQAPAAA